MCRMGGKEGVHIKPCVSSCLCERQCAVVLRPQAGVLQRVAQAQAESETTARELESLVTVNAEKHRELQTCCTVP